MYETVAEEGQLEIGVEQCGGRGEGNQDQLHLLVTRSVRRCAGNKERKQKAEAYLKVIQHRRVLVYVWTDV
ncbi:uncharacterized protein N7498_009178 [Penicillium cinerascens]|uniref:Uncharacterized protein n=1 Tax=Penicillium cinerascens TaxID=70096 RepID=A0A9W9M631_9EURO|nr:uncharacterized protein N7498_009178 [Penicillium cinerascens]KAJ5190193.1 hypothetical protein N7498_009178 [Penicillium cinerascens]